MDRVNLSVLFSEQKIRGVFHWLAAILASVLLVIGLTLITFDVSDLWRSGVDKQTNLTDVLLGTFGLLFAYVVVWTAVRAVGLVRVNRRYGGNHQP